jgi:hypothetical protein
MSLGPRSRIVRRVNIPQARLSEDNIVLLNTERGSYYSLDETGIRIWELIEVETTVQELCEHLGKEYNIGPAVCLVDTINFCQQLHDEDLILCRDGSLE